MTLEINSPIILAQDALFEVVEINGGGGSPIGTFLGLAILIFIIATGWKIFTKAGQPGWAAIIPIYNVIVLLRVAGRPGWWILILWLVIPGIIAVVDLAKKFGKEIGFAIGLIVLPIIFYPILAFGSAQYQGPAAAEGA